MGSESISRKIKKSLAKIYCEAYFNYFSTYFRLFHEYPDLTKEELQNVAGGFELQDLSALKARFLSIWNDGVVEG